MTTPKTAKDFYKKNFSSVPSSNDIVTLFSQQQIQTRVEEIGEQITRDYQDKGDDLILLSVLSGSFLFLADLCRHIHLPHTIEFMGISSYGDSTESSGTVKITLDLKKPIKDKHVIIVEDIIDTGLTADYLKRALETRQPASVSFCTLLHRPINKYPIAIDYSGFEIPDPEMFVLGYGLDYAQRYRNLPFIGVLQKKR